MKKPRKKNRQRDKLLATKHDTYVSLGAARASKYHAKKQKRWDKIGDNIEKFAFVSSVSSCIGRHHVKPKPKMYTIGGVRFTTRSVKTDRQKGIKQPKQFVRKDGQFIVFVGLKREYFDDIGLKRGLDYGITNITGEKRSVTMLASRVNFEKLSQAMSSSFEIGNTK